MLFQKELQCESSFLHPWQPTRWKKPWKVNWMVMRFFRGGGHFCHKNVALVYPSCSWLQISFEIKGVSHLSRRIITKVKPQRILNVFSVLYGGSSNYISKSVTTYRYSNSLFYVTNLQSIRRSKESFLAYIVTLKVKPRQCFHVKK